MFRRPQWISYLSNIARDFPFGDHKFEFFVQQFRALGDKAVFREEFLADLCSRRRVLHFGFLDAPLLQEKINEDHLLHMRLRAKASYLYGVDIDKESLESYRTITKDLDNCIADVTADPLPEALTSGFDLILFPEVLEHVINPGIVLKALHRLCVQNNNATLCVSVPNAYNAAWFMAAMEGREIVHPDHFFYFSPYTLKRILAVSGFTDVKLELYGPPNLLKPMGITGYGLIATCLPEVP